MAVVQKIITGNNQPNAGTGIVSIAGMNGLGASGTLMTEIANTNILQPNGLTAGQLDPPLAWFSYLDTRFDDPSYYFGSGGTP